MAAVHRREGATLNDIVTVFPRRPIQTRCTHGSTSGFLNVPSATTSAAPPQPATPAEPTREAEVPDPTRRRAEPDISEGWQGIWTLLADILGGSGTSKSPETAPPPWPTALTRAPAGPLARKVSGPWRATAQIVIGTALLGVLGLLLRLSLGTWLIIFTVFLVGAGVIFATRWAAQDTLPAIDTDSEVRSNSTPNSNLNSTPNSNLNSNPNSNPNSKANSNLNSNSGSTLNGNSARGGDGQTADHAQDSKLATAVLDTRGSRHLAVVVDPIYRTAAISSWAGDSPSALTLTTIVP